MKKIFCFICDTNIDVIQEHPFIFYYKTIFIECTFIMDGEEEIASKILDDAPSPPVVDPALEAYEKNRFQSQLSAEDWNAQIMANEDKLSPLSMVMQRLAILEEEKNAADRRLEEEYERRMDNEDKYYLEKRRVLEDAIEDIQRDAFVAGDETKEEDAVSSGGGGPKFSA